ncbi:PAN domain protein [Ancylostoma caninum]|uniref:PAN domain protein n=1 Tax=Ancylostoma caninum TaxID=29170 RepID=A0A368H7B8_ANCCA|nr:PAN domain protein [Ancylostoma caninum]
MLSSKSWNPKRSRIACKQSLPAKPIEKPCFTRFKQRMLLGFEEKTITGVDQKGCLLTCLHSDMFYCASANYNEFKRICTLNGGNLHLNDAELKHSTSDYYENECNPERGQIKVANSTATIQPGSIIRCFEELTNSMLLSFDSEVVENVNSLAHCKAECLRAVLNGRRPCGALNWLANSKGCMLFDVGFDLKLIVHHPSAQFLVNKCTGVRRAAPKERGSKVNQP